MKSGRIELNGEPTTLPALKLELKRLRKVHGVVWYAREGPSDEPPADQLTAMQAVLRAVVSESLPIRLFRDANFREPVTLPRT